jgi:hypothetical protein
MAATASLLSASGWTTWVREVCYVAVMLSFLFAIECVDRSNSSDGGRSFTIISKWLDNLGASFVSNTTDFSVC